MHLTPIGLPLEAHLDTIRQQIKAHPSLVISAEPGAGKTTLVPLALLGEDWLADRKILMLEPRRLAAQAAARRMAELLQQPVGQTVGYRIALDSCVGPQTRIEVLTEGILTRMIQTDPELARVGAVIFDEFHERSIHADLALALALEVRDNLRPDLKIIVMSATLDLTGVSGLLGGAPSLDCAGRSFPVTVTHFPIPEHLQNPWNHGPQFSPAYTAQKIRDALAELPGDVLVFLPGQGEINRVQAELAKAVLPAEVCPLYGNMTGQDQLRVLQAPRPGQRRVILSTSLAETSLTIPGVRVVIDAGLARFNRFDPRNGLDRLVTERLTQASSTQRQGRAGRTGPGHCWKLWPGTERLQAFTDPEINRSDLTPLVLEAAVWGAQKPTDLLWLTPPSTALWQQARDLLTDLDALEAGGRITVHGRAMVEKGLHPRLAHMVLRSAPLGLEALAWACAVLLADRDIFVSSAEVDFRLRLEVFFGFSTGGKVEINGPVLDRAKEAFRRGCKPKAGRSVTPADIQNSTGLVLALAFPDRFGLQQTTSGNTAQFKFANGRSGTVNGYLAKEASLVAPEVDAGGTLAKIFLAAPLSITEFKTHFAAHFTVENEVTWTGLKPRLRRTQVFHKLPIDSREQVPGPDDLALICQAFFSVLAEHGLDLLPWDEDLRADLARWRFASHHLAQRRPDLGPWPDLGPEALLPSAETWLAPFLKVGKGPILDNFGLHEALEARFTWPQRNLIHREAPSHLTVPSGSRRRLEYQGLEPPILPVRIQEVFGLPATPQLCGQPLVLHLLSPAQRPLQVTADLASFWKNTYPEVKKEMKGRYPRHYWPDDPLQAEPTARAKPRGT